MKLSVTSCSKQRLLPPCLSRSTLSCAWQHEQCTRDNTSKLQCCMCGVCDTAAKTFSDYTTKREFKGVAADDNWYDIRPFPTQEFSKLRKWAEKVPKGKQTLSKSGSFNFNKNVLLSRLQGTSWQNPISLSFQKTEGHFQIVLQCPHCFLIAVLFWCPLPPIS